MVALRSMVACLFMLTLGPPLTAESQPSSERVLFIPLATPCRALDTRLTGPPVPANEPTTIQISGTTLGGDCGVPDTAVGAALNFTITEAQGSGHLRVWPSGDLPPTSVVNFTPGEDVANAVDIGLGAGGTVQVQPIATTHLVVDIYGYFTGGELAGSNTALGDLALSNTTGTNNTALGASALLNNTTGSDNTATGFNALLSNTTTNRNTAIGVHVLHSNTAGDDNTAIGFSALSGAITPSSGNIAIGSGAGALVTTGSENIHIGHVGFPADDKVIRIGRLGHTRTFIAGIFGFTADGGIPVLVNNDGQLGTVSSSRRVKNDIRGMDEASAGLGKLRPVVFRYKAELANGPRLLEYGLIAEEVAEIYPELVVRGTDDQPAGVKYHVLPAMLLNEFQRQQRQLESQAARLEAQRRELEELRAQVRALIGARASSRE